MHKDHLLISKDRDKVQNSNITKQHISLSMKSKK